jgi:hypothetical protein
VALVLVAVVAVAVVLVARAVVLAAARKTRMRQPRLIAHLGWEGHGRNSNNDQASESAPRRTRSQAAKKQVAVNQSVGPAITTAHNSTKPWIS